MRITRWGFLLAVLLALAPMFALQMFTVGDGVGIGPPAVSVDIQSAQENPDVINGITAATLDGAVTQPNSVSVAGGGPHGYLSGLINDESNYSIDLEALAPSELRLWRQEHASECGHYGSWLTAVGGEHSKSARGAMALPGTRTPPA